MNHFYSTIDGYFNFESVYSKAVANCSENSHFVEIGAYKGKSTAYMAVEIINSLKKIKFDVIDIWVNTYDIFTRNLMPVKHVLTPIRMDSSVASTQYSNESLDFVFIDAEHDYFSVLNDIIIWYPKIKKNGIIAGHDFHENFPGVEQAVKNFFINDFSLDVTSWIHIKKNYLNL